MKSEEGERGRGGREREGGEREGGGEREREGGICSRDIVRSFTHDM